MTLKLNKSDQNILINFAKINKSMILVPGKEQTTIDTNKKIFARGTLSFGIPYQLGFYDTEQFLKFYDLLGEPELDFQQDRVDMVKPDGESVHYYYSNENVLNVPRPSREPDVSNPTVMFQLTKEKLNNIKTSVGIFSSQNMAICLRNGSIDVKVSQAASQSTYTVHVGSIESPKKFNAVINSMNLKIVPDDYDVSVYEPIVNRGPRVYLVSKNSNLNYIIPCESESTFD